jgi:hypothetical protein
MVGSVSKEILGREREIQIAIGGRRETMISLGGGGGRGGDDEG